MAHYTVVVPVTSEGGERTFYRRVGALFENHQKDTGEIYFNIVLDFPVGATQMLAFPPRSRDDGAAA